MFCKRILLCAITTVCLCVALGCGSDKPEKTSSATETLTPAEKKSSLMSVTLSGGDSSLTLDLPFDVPAPKDESDGITPELKDIIMSSCSYTARNDEIVFNVFCATFNAEIIANASEDDFYNAMDAELQDLIAKLNANNNFSDLKTDSLRTTIDGKPALIMTATYLLNGTDRTKSNVVYVFNGADMWRLIYDYRDDYEPAADIVDASINSIKLK